MDFVILSIKGHFLCFKMGFFSTIVIIALFHGIAAEGLGQEGN